MLEIKKLCFRHKGSKEDTLKDIEFSAELGKVTAILGPNGSGKSTLFKCIAGIWKPYKGSICINGKEIDKLSYLERAKIFAVVPQEHEPAFPYSVFDMVLIGRAPYVNFFSSPGLKDYEKAKQALQTLGIYHLKEKSYDKISGGERQLVLIARALAQSAPFMLLDEPVSHLDFRNQIKVLLKIKELAYKNKITALVTIHDPNLASLFADKIVVIKDGRIIGQGKPNHILNEKLIQEVYGIKINIIQNNGFNLICPVLDFLKNKQMGA
ncbi:MAG: ABC transporter ATP-binding protein [Thermodesulfobacterium sp.]|nr:ABC transporter ATP-binding protein [Thermodesulfobacterium sp.]